MALHIALLGDSVFDNHAYTNGAPDVSAHLRAALGADDKVTLVAVDGATTTDVGEQIDRCPRDASHVVLSVGGNDALMNAGLLNTPVPSTGVTLDLFTSALAELEANYANVLDALGGRGGRLIVCTIYNGNLDAAEAGRARTALMMFNDTIIRSAATRAIEVIELRTVCTATSDFANPIEPSGEGGRKIARVIAAAARAPRHDATVIYTGTRALTE